MCLSWKKKTGLKFTWPGVKKLKVPHIKNLVKKIKSIKDAKEAANAISSGSFAESVSGSLTDEELKKMARDLKKGIIPEALLSDDDLSTRELQQKKFKLNLVLPG